MSSKNSPSEPFYISLEVVLEIHQRQLKEFGGSDGVRNPSGLESAINVPTGTFAGQDLYPTVFAKAAAYAMIGIAERTMSKDDLALLFERLTGKK